MTGKRRLTGLLVAAVVAALGAGSTLLGSALATGDSAPGATAAKARAPKLVAKVTALSGTRLYVKRKRGGKLTKLARGGKVYLQDIVAVGPGTKATLKLSIPKGVPDTTELLNLYKQLGKRQPRAAAVDKEIAILIPFARTHRTLKLKRTGQFIEAMLSR